jgi:hypothetical protein
MRDSVNKQDLRKNLKFFNEPEANIQSIYSKVAMRLFDVYANMYITRFSGRPTRLETSSETQPTPIVITPLIRTMVTFRPDKYKIAKKKSVRRRKINHLHWKGPSGPH